MHPLAYAARPVDSADVYGIQREMLSMARHDGEGQPRAHRYLNIFEMVRIRGPVSPAVLERAVTLVSAEVDIFRSRFRSTPSGHRVVLAPSVPWVSFEVLTFHGRLDDFADSAECEALRHVAYTARDLRYEPLVQVRVVRLGDDDHLLLVVLDHAVADGRTLMVFIRAVARCYTRLFAGPDAAALDAGVGSSPFCSFLRFANSFVHSDADRDSSRAFWSRALGWSADPASQPRFPGGHWKPRQERQLSKRVEVPLDGDRSAVLTAVSTRLEVTTPQLLLAVTSLVVSAWSGTFAPVNYMRHGRFRREWISVPGPLADHCVTVEPTDNDGTVDGWLAGFVRANEAGPPLHGLSFREFETPDTDDNRLVLFNYLPSVSPARFGPALARRAGPLFVAAIREYDHSSRFAVRLHLWQYPGEPTMLAVDHDPEVLPDGRDLLDAILAVVDAGRDQPGANIDAVGQAIRRQWGSRGLMDSPRAPRSRSRRNRTH